MNFSEPKISALGERALVVEFGRSISVELNVCAVSLSKYLEDHPFPGFIASAPAYASTLVEFDPHIVRANSTVEGTAFDSVVECVRRALPDVPEIVPTGSDVIDIAVHFGGENGPDLEFVADAHGLTTKDVVAIFTSRSYRVYMVGFLPGFAYLGELDESIATPRRESPRVAVPKGSVGIADRQTGIYPMESPGGWQLVGRTDVDFFTPEDKSPCLIGPGDMIRFTIA